ncbi:MAG TPA: rhodanese-like domain-containing protein [Thermoanaerobaculia bacterium]|nr:rhodanese-like domain-containing protein [Thermoanaerobaculia bacterium]
MKSLLFALFLATAAPLAGQSPLAWPLPKPPTPEPVFPEILVSPAWLKAALPGGGVVPLDVRPKEAYAAGHLPGAAPAWRAEEEGDFGVGRVRSLLAARGISGAETVVLYGGADDAEAIGRLFWLLEWAGCAGVKVLDGGVPAWTAAGGALAAGPPPPAAGAFTGKAREEAAVSVDEVFQSFDRAGVELLDLRDARGWERWQTPPGFAAGHIPHALPFDVRWLFPADGSWPDPGAARRKIGETGPRPGDPVGPDSSFILYGDDAKDPRPGLGYLLFRRAGVDVRVFPGGFPAWAAEPARPIVRVVTAAELRALLDREASRPILLDLRGARDFELDHLPGARSLPYHRFEKDFEKTVAEGWPGVDRATVPLVLYCYGNDCVRSREGGTRAARLGFRNILWFRGGITEWRAAGYPLPEPPR